MSDKIKHVIISELMDVVLLVGVVLIVGAWEKDRDTESLQAGRECKPTRAHDPVVHSALVSQPPSDIAQHLFPRPPNPPLISDEALACIAGNLLENETGERMHFKTVDDALPTIKEEFGERVANEWTVLRHVSHRDGSEVVSIAKELARGGHDDVALGVLGYLQWSQIDEVEARIRVADRDTTDAAREAVDSLNERWMPWRVFSKYFFYFFLGILGWVAFKTRRKSA